MRVLLRDLAPGQNYALRFRLNNGGEVSAWSPIQRVTVTADQTPPSPVTGLDLYAAIKPTASSVNQAKSFIAEWDAVTTEATPPPGSPAPLKDFRHYRLNFNNGTKSADFITTDTRFEFTADMNVTAFGQYENQITLTIYAVDMTYNESAPAVTVVSVAPPPIPSAPVLSNYFGSVLVTFDGNDSTGVKMPNNVDLVEVHVGQVPGFVATPGGATLMDRIVFNDNAASQKALLTNLVQGQQYYAKLIAVNAVGKSSNPSAASNAITKTNLTGLQIENGSLNPDQMNFTARQLGGANAYYGTAFPTGGTYKSGDIFYNTAIPPAANAGKTYRHNGTTWVEDASIGTISGLKILTNTLTADAVGTNELITAKANIAALVVDDGHIDFLNANKITAGILESSFLVTYGGVEMPAWSFDVNGNATVNNATVNGSLVLGNSSNPEALNTAASAKSFNFVPGVSGWIIRGDGTVEFGEATLRGEFRTATDGRRIEVASAGFTGQIDFWAPNAQRTYIRSVTEQNALSEEALQFGVGAPGSAWNTMVINMAQGGIMTQRAKTFDMYASQEFRLSINDTIGNLGSTTKQRLRAYKTGFGIYDQAGFMRFGWDSTDTINRTHMYVAPAIWHTFWETGGLHIMTDKQDGYTSLSNTIICRYGVPTNSMWALLNPASVTSSHKMQFQNNSAQGAIIKTWGSNVEVRTVSDGGFAPVLASAFTQSSDESFKTGIEGLPVGKALETAKQIKPKRFRRKDRRGIRLAHPEEVGNLEELPPAPDEPLPPLEVGFIAQEMPQEMTIRGSDGTLAIDMGQVLATLYGAFNEHIEEGESWNEANKAEIGALRESVETRLAAIEAAVKALTPKGQQK